MNRHPRRRLPDLQGRVGRLRARELLRPRPRGREARRGLQRRPALEPQARRPRLPQGLRGVQGRDRSTRASRPSSSRRPIKGYGLGPSFEGRNATHQMKKLTLDNLKQFRDVMRIPITDAQLEAEPVPAAVLPPRPGRRGDPVPAGAPPRSSAATCRSAARSTRRSRCPTTRPTRSSRRAPASRRSPPPWRSPACSRTC